MSYPHHPGSQPTPTSIEAAPTPATASRLRQMTINCLRSHGAQTPDECATRLGLSILSIRPRFTELKRLGQIVATGDRRANRSGKSASVFSLHP